MPHVDTDPVQILNRDKQAAARLVEGVGKARTFELLKRAQTQLSKRLIEAEGLKGPGKGSYTANQLRQTLMQVRAVTTGLKVGMKDLTTAQGLHLAQQAAKTAANYLQASERKFKGSTHELSLDRARLMDRSVAGAHSSILRRLMSDPKHPAHKGILDRYGDAVVTHFEDTLQTAVVARTPWNEVRQQLIDGSPFLQQAPASWAERIVRTESMQAHGVASHAAIVDAQQQLGDMVKIISSVFDSRTGSDSFSVHGQIRRPAESFDSWFGPYMHPPDRPNDRSVVVPHRISWPIPANLKAKDGGTIAARWALEGRKGSPPPQPNITTVPLDQFGKAPVRQPDSVQPPEAKPPVEQPKRVRQRKPPEAATERPSHRLFGGVDLSPRAGVSPLVEQSHHLADHFDDLESGGRWIRQALREQIAHSLPGIEPSRDLGRGAEFEIESSPVLQKEGLEAAHGSNGDVSFQPKILKNAQLVFESLQSGALEGAASKVVRHSNGFATVDPSITKSIQGIGALRTLVHEEVHGHSRSTHRSYRHEIGRVLEEVGTELTARHVVLNLTPGMTGLEDKLNGVKRVLSGGKESIAAYEKGKAESIGFFAAYQPEIDAVRSIVAKHAGVEPSEAQRLIVDAHRKGVMGAGESFETGEQHLDAFTGALAVDQKARDAIRQDLHDKFGHVEAFVPEWQK